MADNCYTTQQIQVLVDSMTQLQSALKAISENWNDAVAASIQAIHINTIISLCNTTNGQLMGIQPTLKQLYNEFTDIV